MSKRYSYLRTPRGRRYKILLLCLGVIIGLMALGGYLIYRDLKANQNAQAEGGAQAVPQEKAEVVRPVFIDEPYFSMALPSDWKEIDRRHTARERSITWQATKKGADNRWLKLYIDTIPSDIAVNRLLPVSTHDNKLTFGILSDNCSTFTQGGTLNVAEAIKLQPAPAKWQKVDFTCNLPQVIDNQVGTGSVEEGMSVSVSGPSQGAHRYFFLYTDRNIQPRYSILYDALRSFEAK